MAPAAMAGSPGALDSAGVWASRRAGGNGAAADASERHARHGAADDWGRGARRSSLVVVAALLPRWRSRIARGRCRCVGLGPALRGRASSRYVPMCAWQAGSPGIVCGSSAPRRRRPARLSSPPSPRGEVASHHACSCTTDVAQGVPLCLVVTEGGGAGRTAHEPARTVALGAGAITPPTLAGSACSAGGGGAVAGPRGLVRAPRPRRARGAPAEPATRRDSSRGPA